VTRTHLYTHVGGIALNRYDTWLATWRLFHRKGIENLIITQHEDAWSNGADVGQGGQEYTMCIEAAPEVGDEKMIAYCKAVREMATTSACTRTSPTTTRWASPGTAATLPATAGAR